MELTLDAGGGVELRLLEDADAEPLRALIDAHREYLRQWLPWVDASRTVEDVLAFIRGSAMQLAANNGFGMTIRFQGRLAGCIGVHQIVWRDRATSIGYWLAEDLQGHGIVTRACQALIAYLFGTLELHRVEIRCATGNHRSCAIPERLGFRHEGVLRDAEWVNDRFVDLNVYGLLAG